MVYIYRSTYKSREVLLVQVACIPGNFDELQKIRCSTYELQNLAIDFSHVPSELNQSTFPINVPKK